MANNGWSLLVSVVGERGKREVMNEWGPIFKHSSKSGEDNYMNTEECDGVQISGEVTCWDSSISLTVSTSALPGRNNFSCLLNLIWNLQLFKLDLLLPVNVRKLTVHDLPFHVDQLLPFCIAGIFCLPKWTIWAEKEWLVGVRVSEIAKSHLSVVVGAPSDGRHGFKPNFSYCGQICLVI